MARYVRLLMPLIRMMRAFGFLSRGMDRLVRRYGYLLNRNIILHPTVSERREIDDHEPRRVDRGWALRNELTDSWKDLLREAAPEQREDVGRARLEAFARARQQGWLRPPTPSSKPIVDMRPEITADALLQRMSAATPEQLETEYGSDFVQRASRAVRTFSRAPIRWLPVIRRYVPRLSPTMSDADVTVAASRQASRELKRQRDRALWIADLHGTVTPAEFVDRVGNALVRGSSRPAYRLLLFGTFYLLVQLLLSLGAAPSHPTHADTAPAAVESADHAQDGGETPSVAPAPPGGWLHRVSRWLESYVGTTLLILGSICLIILSIGWWLRRVAGQATSFYEQLAHANFLALTEAFKGRNLEHDSAVLDRRVLRPEDALVGRVSTEWDFDRRAAFQSFVESWLVKPHAGLSDRDVNETMERVALLYRDNLDGALFGESDARTTSQLLGAPAIAQMRAWSQRMGKKENKALARLDLAGGRSTIRGPYLWFSFVCKAMSQTCARLIDDYCRHAVPLGERVLLPDGERLSFEQWLHRQPRTMSDSASERPSTRSSGERDYITNEFTALHFLDDDPHRDAEVATLFGDDVLVRLQDDRKMLFRQVFGTYPLDARPRERRVLNLYRTYLRWLGGGRALVLPLRVMGRSLRALGRGLAWTVRAVGQIRQPRAELIRTETERADFHAALRKIDRMRGPIVWAALWMRACFDAEYMGARIPRSDATGMEGADIDDDLAFIEATPDQLRRIDRERDRAASDMRTLSTMMDDGLVDDVAAAMGVPVGVFDMRMIRALAVCYRADYLGLRTDLSADQILSETTAAAAQSPLRPARGLIGLTLRPRFRRWWAQHGVDDKFSKKAAWRAMVHNVDGVGDALRVWDEPGSAAARDRGRGQVGRHPTSSRTREFAVGLPAYGADPLLARRSKLPRACPPPWRLRSARQAARHPRRGVTGIWG